MSKMGWRASVQHGGTTRCGRRVGIDVRICFCVEVQQEKAKRGRGDCSQCAGAGLLEGLAHEDAASLASAASCHIFSVASAP